MDVASFTRGLHPAGSAAGGPPSVRALSVAAWVPAFTLLTVFGAELGAILVLNEGHLVYNLDDPYIHLALAENIARGQYGVNLEEVSAPSSSILWPLLLVPF